jgi:site-specific recombinase XerD
VKQSNILVSNPAPVELQGRLHYVNLRIAHIFDGNPEFVKRLSELVEEWVTYMLVSRGKSEHTAFTYLTHILYLFDFIKQSQADLYMPSSQAMQLVMWLPRELSGTTKNIALYAARSFYKWLSVAKSTTEIQVLNPFRDVEGVKTPQRLPRPISEDGYMNIYEIIWRMRKDTTLSINKRFLVDFELFGFLMLMNSGMRTMELLPIRFSDINRKDGILTALIWGKGEVQRFVAISDVYGLFKTFLSPRLFDKEIDIEDFFFEGLALGRAKGTKSKVFEGLSRHVLYDLLRSINKFPKLVKNEPETEYTLHQFRHTYATWMLNHPVKRLPIEEVMALLGHKSITTTMVYAKVEPVTILQNLKEQKRS